MIKLICVLVGIYLVFDAIYLASHAQSEKRFCMIAKYMGALMSGVYLVCAHASESRLLFGVTIALFMWPETFYRLIAILQTDYPNLYLKYLMHFNLKSRRKADYDNRGPAI